MAEVAGDEHVGGGDTRVAEKRVSGPAADCDGLDDALVVAGHADAAGCRRQQVGQKSGERHQRHRPLEPADDAEPGLARRVGGARFERTLRDEPELRGQHTRGSRRDDIRVRVGREKSGAARDEALHDGALRGVGRDRGHAVEEQRVVHEQQVGTQGDRLVDGVEDGVDREMDVIDRGRRVAHREPGGVPALGAAEGPEGFDGFADGLEVRHDDQPSRSRSGRTADGGASGGRSRRRGLGRPRPADESHSHEGDHERGDEAHGQ